MDGSCFKLIKIQIKTIGITNIISHCTAGRWKDITRAQFRIGDLSIWNYTEHEKEEGNYVSHNASFIVLMKFNKNYRLRKQEFFQMMKTIKRATKMKESLNQRSRANWYYANRITKKGDLLFFLSQQLFKAPS